jgi:prepilin-type processing-associated H-X9-DG protein
MPIDFTCTHCGATTNVADQYAGATGPCARCGQTITVPVAPGVLPPAGFDAPPKRGISGGAIAAIVMVVALAVITPVAILIALLVPAVQAAREAARQVQCRNNLKQIALAVLNYEQVNGCFPPAYIADKSGKPMHSWRVLILPYLEENGLYQQYRFDEPWDGPHNKMLAPLMPSVYRCPSEPQQGGSLTSYLMLVGPHAISDGPKPRRLQDITDGTSNTILVAECATEEINWMEPRDLNAEKMVFTISGSERERSQHGHKSRGITSNHPGTACVAFCDGSVSALSSSTPPETVKAMTTIDGGEVISPEYLSSVDGEVVIPARVHAKK